MSKIAEIVKYEGDNSTFIWKHPSEDFNKFSQLIVHENQEAVFFMNGQALDSFGPGRYTLNTQNIPILRHFIAAATGGDSPFHCEVYFINKTVQMAIKWGTDSKVRFLEPTYGVPLEIGASGEMNLMVSDARKLLVKLVGTMNGIAWEDRSGDGFTKSLSASFRPMISTAVKTNLASAIKEHNINILEIDEHLEALSDVLKRSITPGFEEYGLTIPAFYVNTVVLPENDPNFRRIRDLHSVALQKKSIETEAELTAAQRQIMREEETTKIEKARREAELELIRAQAEAQKTKLAGLAEAEVMRAKGYDHKDELQAEVQKAYAEGIGNMTITGGGGVAGDMIGLGVGMAAAGAVAPQLGEMFKGFSVPATTPVEEKATAAKCASCGAALPEGAKFCLECGEKVVAADMIVCPQCGKTVAKGKFCLECGTKL